MDTFILSTEMLTMLTLRDLDAFPRVRGQPHTTHYAARN